MVIMGWGVCIAARLKSVKFPHHENQTEQSQCYCDCFGLTDSSMWP